MKAIIKNDSLLYIIFYIFLISGCTSTHNSKVVGVSNVHLYNSYYGVIANPEADRQIQEELLSQNRPVEVEIPYSDDPTITTELRVDPDAVTADKLVIPPPVITYKYMDDNKFYTENQLRSRER